MGIVLTDMPPPSFVNHPGTPAFPLPPNACVPIILLMIETKNRLYPGDAIASERIMNLNSPATERASLQVDPVLQDNLVVESDICPAALKQRIRVDLRFLESGLPFAVGADHRGMFESVKPG